ncbi:LCP family protein [Candidatus Uhrbacteria bacterium]|nr:LCP family protein [Candidatus Uhrbacteria bacterium]
MDPLQIDFLRKKYRLEGDPGRPSLFGRWFIVAAIVLASAGGLFSYGVSTSAEATTASFPHFSLFSSLRQLVQAGDKQLKGEREDRINLLLLGVGGEGHDGPELSDTIIFTSIRPSTTGVGMLSIPRDLTVPIPGYGLRKVNHVNAFAEQEEPGSGPSFTSELLGDLFGQDIPYYVKVDFDGFADAIDAVGGVDIYVDRGFTDAQYPTEDYLVQTVSFQEGWQHMDGETALTYTRSRHGNNGEGSDFARSARQQKILLALKEKTLQKETLTSPSKVSGLLASFGNHVQTNLSLWELLRLGTMLKDVDPAEIVNHVLDVSPESPLYETSLNGAYVVLPKNDDWGPVQRMAANVFYPGAQGEDVKDTPAPTFVRVEVQNGTRVNGLAFETSQLLEREGFEVVKIGNAAERGYAHTVVYDLTQGQRAAELRALQELLEADVSMSAAGWLFSKDVIPKEISISDDEAERQTTGENIDFLVILGDASAPLVRR